MRSITRDPLLAIARGVVFFSMGLCVLVGAIMTVLAPFMVFGRFDIMAKASGDVEGLTSQTFLAIGAVMLLVAVGAVLGFLFLRHLLRIIDSVGLGDPFVPINATRLAAMAWLTLAIEALTFPIGGLALWIARAFPEGHSDLQVGFSMSGLLLAVILFILARVFRKGAEMRADLEGMV
ncbi:DUF2975 domain-containing protein [Novosphingobium kaempferiae]|uniref:DUF2975 domain-containing protein n=1 Tax=Novosphingobium kaempferiae TaxID=2896849 RepID=UPI001E64FE53|nr:DUF2975 domain-containing protein [Novosphingobium kaempferiae]